MLQTKLGPLLFKNEFGLATTNKLYRETLKYYGYSEHNLPNSIIYPLPIIKNSRTYMKQASLPHLPVRQLEVTLSKYLTAAKPLLNQNEFENTKKIVDDFMRQDGLGQKLQRLLQEKATRTDNWLAQWWLDKVYLEPRYPTPINVNPNILYPKANYNTLDEQLAFATNYIYAFIEYKKMLDSQQLPVERYLDQPLCMDQYYKVIGTCRIPKRDKDLLKIHQPYLYTSKHVTVMYKNRLFSLQVIDPNTDTPLDKTEIYTNLKSLVENTKSENNNGLGILTTENRDLWADNYEILLRDGTNKANFDSIHDSLFVLCLDDDIPTTSRNNDERSLAAAQLLHGNKAFTSNRWFDKTIQVIVGANGVCGMNFEHSVGEGLPFAHLSDFALSYVSKCDKTIASTNLNKQNYKELVFNIPRNVEQAIETSKKNFYKMIDDLELYILNFDVFGKNFAKTQKISPDALVQISMQLAYFKIHNTWGNAYESGSLRRFQLGRTEVIRSCTESTTEFLKSMSKNSNKTNQERAILLRNAIKAHTDFTKTVLNFDSFDRHLMGLKLIALENKIELPELYKDVAFQRLTKYVISTSQISSKHTSVVTFGPAVSDGYGICYNILDNNLIFGLSTFNSCESTSAKRYGDSLRSALIDCQAILSNSKTAKL